MFVKFVNLSYPWHVQVPNTLQVLGPVYTKRQRQSCDNSAMILVILFSLKTVESLQIWVTTHFRVTLLFSKRTVLLASSQSCRSVDAEAWCRASSSYFFLFFPIFLGILLFFLFFSNFLLFFLFFSHFAN